MEIRTNSEFIDIMYNPSGEEDNITFGSCIQLTMLYGHADGHC